jgi:YggT family protein
VIALGNILIGIGTVLDMVLGLVLILVIARAILSWVNPDPYNPIVRFLMASTEPFLRPLRRYIPAFGGIDFTPIILLVLIYFLRLALAQTLIEYGQSMKHTGLLGSAPEIHFQHENEIQPTA